jgi:hypothetical protein
MRGSRQCAPLFISVTLFESYYAIRTHPVDLARESNTTQPAPPPSAIAAYASALYAFLPTPMHLAPPYALFAKGTLSTRPRAARGPDTTSPQSHRNLPGRGPTSALAHALFLSTLWLGVGRSRVRWVCPALEAHFTSPSTSRTSHCQPARAVKACGEAICRTCTLLCPWLQRRHRRQIPDFTTSTLAAPLPFLIVGSKKI